MPRGSPAFVAVLAATLLVALVFLTIPIAAIFLEAGPGELISSLDSESAREALRLSLMTSGIALGIILLVGTPAAYLLATRRFRGRNLAITLIELPLVVPPAVAGIALLAAFGPEGLLGGLIADAGIRLVFETAGVVVALVFVASPFYLRQAQAAFASLDRELIESSLSVTSEAKTLWYVAIPVARGGLVAGAALAWGRALGEFGATLVFAGSFQGITQTAPLAIVELYGTNFTGALALSAVLIAVAAALLATVRIVSGERILGSTS
jgi:molybdate transport system permease protein